jgi:threonine dehydratase
VYSAGSAGVAIACYAKHRDSGRLAGSTCVIVCCGGNVSDATMQKAEAVSLELLPV